MRARHEMPERLQVGVSGLDYVLNGGLPRNRIYLLEGTAGTGKTTLALQFLLEGVARGESCLYVTLSETREELFQVAESHGWSLDGISIYDLAIPEDAASEQGHYTLFHPSEIELSDTTKAIWAEVERIQPTRVVFDSLSEMRLLAGDALRYRRQILSLKQFFVGRKCTVLLLDDHTSETSDRQLESLAHGVIMLEHTSPGYGAPRRRVRILKLRGVNFRGGYHDFNIRTGGVEVYPRLVAADHRTEFVREPMKSGIAELDALTGGGIDTGTATLIMGPAGTGKSVLSTCFIHNATSRNVRAAYFTFEESKATLLGRAASVGMDLRPALAAGTCLVRQIDPAELMPGEFADLVCQAVEKDGARVVAIDSLNGYFQAMPEERYLAAHMHEMLSYLGERGVATILVAAQQGMFASAMPQSVDISYLADTVLLLRFFEFGGRVRQAISVVKKRSGNHERAIREVKITGKGLVMGPPLTEFRGVLTGVPEFIGNDAAMIEGQRDESR